MKQRWRSVAILAGVLFSVNVVGRLVVRFVAEDNEGVVGTIALVAVGLVTAGAMVRWAPRRPMARVTGDIILASLLGGVLSLTVGPFISEGELFGTGVGYYLAELFSYLVVCGAGAFLGALSMIILAKDYKSEAWKQRAEVMGAKPRRTVRG